MENGHQSIKVWFIEAVIINLYTEIKFNSKDFNAFVHKTIIEILMLNLSDLA